MNIFKLIYLNEITLATVNHLYLKQDRLSNLSNKSRKIVQNLAGYRDTAFRMRNENCFGGNINVPSSGKCLSEALSIL